MKKIALGLLFLCMAIPMQLCFGVEASTSWDFGNVEEGLTVRHFFSLKNESNKPMRIKEMTTSCGCTGSAAKKKNLKPGEATEIEVKFKSRGYSGPVTQYAYIHTDNPKNSIIRFTIKANVIKAKEG